MPSEATNGHGPKGAILYARISTDEQPAQATNSSSSSRPSGSTLPVRLRGLEEVVDPRERREP